MTILAVGIMLFAIFQIATSVMVPSYGGVVVGLIMFGAANAMWIIAAEGALPFLFVLSRWRGLHADLGLRDRTA